MDLRDEIDELRAAVHRDPARVAVAASRLATTARAAGDPATLSRVLAVLGRARRALGAIDLAEADLTGAVEAATGAGDRELAADAHLGLAGVYAFTGRSAEALAHLDSVQQLGSPKIRAYGLLQRAALEQRIGHLHEALAGYERALPTLRALDARVDVAIVLMNRGVIRTQLADSDAAIADLSEAGRLFAAEDNGYAEAQTWHGVGWAYASKGDLTTTLRYLDDATERFRELGHTAPDVEVDRGEVLLAAGLSSMAVEVARDVAERLAAAGNHWHVALAWLLCARANLLDGDRVGAAGYAERARSIFAEHGSAAWERAARLELVRARAGGGRPADVAELRDLAGPVRRGGQRPGRGDGAGPRVRGGHRVRRIGAGRHAVHGMRTPGRAAGCLRGTHAGQVRDGGLRRGPGRRRLGAAPGTHRTGGPAPAPRLDRGTRRAGGGRGTRRPARRPRPAPGAQGRLGGGGPGLDGAGPRSRTDPAGATSTGRRRPGRAVERAALGGRAGACGRVRRPRHGRPAAPAARPRAPDPPAPAAVGARRVGYPQSFPAQRRRAACRPGRRLPGRAGRHRRPAGSELPVAGGPRRQAYSCSPPPSPLSYRRSRRGPRPAR